MTRAMMLIGMIGVLCAWTHGSNIITLSDFQFFGSGVWSAFMSPVNAPPLISGIGFTESLAINPRTIPAGTVARWQFPGTPPKSGGVYGFIAQNYGDNNGGPHTTPSVQIKSLQALVSTHDINITGATDNYDIIYDAFLTKTPYTDNIDEFSVSVHTNATLTDFVASIPQIGSFIGSGVTWVVVQSAPGGQIIFMPADKRDELSVTLDLKAMLAYLVSKGVLTGDEYFNGIALGIEPHVNGGSVTYNSWLMVQS